MAAQIERIQSFSVSPDDVDNVANIIKLREYCAKSGMSFSFLVLKGLSTVVAELKDKGAL